MSYDYLLVKLSNPDLSAATIDRRDCIALGTPAEVRSLLDQAVPGMRWTWRAETGAFGAGDQPFRLEFFVSEREPLVWSIGVQGASGRTARDFLKELCRRYGFTTIDLQTMEMWR